MAGSPGGIGKPARVTMPTPGPALKRMPSPPSRTVAITMQPWVTSGIIARVLDDSRPRPALALLLQRQRKGRRLALGQRDRDRIGELPVRNAANAAFTAAVAHAPVVQPRLNSPSGFSIRIGPLYKAAMGLGPTKRIGDWVSAGEQQTGFARLDAEPSPPSNPAGSGWWALAPARPASCRSSAITRCRPATSSSTTRW